MKYESTTTLNRIRAESPCEEGWADLLKHLGKTNADDEPLSLLSVLDSNGLDDALWVLSYAMPDDRLARHFQAWCAEQVIHIFEADRPNDTRVRDQIAMLRNDDATDEERAAAWDAARDAAWGAAWGAKNAASIAIWDAARGAAYLAARIAAGHTSIAIWDAARGAQEKQLRLMIGGGSE